MLGYKPNQFFNQLEHLDRLAEISGTTKDTVRVTISRAKRTGLLRLDENDQTVVTWRGKIKTKLRPRQKLRHNLVIIFDVPEKMKAEREKLRAYLTATGCEMVQKSVWKTKYDIHDELREAIDDLGLSRYVSLFLADELNSATET